MTPVMFAGFNGLDYAIVGIIVIGTLHGLTRGALRMATSIMSLALGIYVASVYYGRVAKLAEAYLRTSPTVSAIIGYAVVFAIVFFAVEYAGARAVQLARIIHLNWADRLAGGAFGAGIAAVLAGLGVVAMTAVLPNNPAMLRDSRLAPRVLQYNQALLGYVPVQVKTSYEEKRNELMRYWTERNESPDAKPSPARESGPR